MAKSRAKKYTFEEQIKTATLPVYYGDYCVPGYECEPANIFNCRCAQIHLELTNREEDRKWAEARKAAKSAD